MAQNERITQLVIRGRDEFSQVLKNLETRQKQAAESGTRALRKLNLEYSVATRKALQDTQAQIKNLAAEFRTLSQAEGDNRAQIAQVVIAKAKLQVKAQELKATLGQLRASTVGLTQAQKGSFVQFSQSADGIQREGASAQATAAKLNILTGATNRAAAAQKNLAAQSNRASASVAGGGRGGRAARGEQQDVAIWGLKPWQLTNLGYQVNDVISGLAMGQNPIQILAQQAGQFAQIWPDVMVGLAKGIPLLAGTTAVLSPFIAALIRVRTEANSVKTFTTNLALLADGGRYTADGLAKITAELDRVGVAVKDAREGVLSLVKMGFSQGEIKPIAEIARQLTKITGNEFTDEVKRVGEAFSGNAESVRKLDKELQFLTADQLQQVYALEKSGDASGALAIAQDALREKLKASRQELTPWRSALEKISSAWNTFVDLIANSTLFKDFMRDLGQLAEDFERIARGIDSASKWVQRSVNPTADQQYQSNLARRNDLQRQLAPYAGTTDPFYAMQAQGLRDELDGVNAEIKEYEDGLKRAAATVAATTAAQQVTAGLTEEEKKDRLEIQMALDAKIASLAQEAELAVKTSREQYVQKTLLDAQNEAKEKGLKLSQDQLDALREQAGLTFDATNSALATGNYGSIVDRIIGIESGGNASAKNPNSTATGLGQFIESTWLAMFKKHFPDRAASMTDAAILALRKDAQISRSMVEAYAQENAKVLQAAGVAVTDASVYLAHFLGPQGAIATLRAAPGATTDQFLGQGQIAANSSILEGKTAQQVLDWAARKMQMTDQEVAASQRLNELDAERIKKQTDYTTGLKQRIADQQFELEQIRQSGRQAAINKAIRDEELKAQEAGVELSKEQRDTIAETTGKLYDQQNAMAAVDAILERRSQLVESLEIAQTAGDSGKVQQIIAEIGETEDELTRAIDAAIAFYQALGGPAADAAILKLQNLKDTVGETVRDLETRFLPSAEELNEQIADAGSNAFSKFAEAIANGESAFASFRDALLQGLGEIIVEIGKAIVKQALFNAISGGSAGGGAGSAISGWVAGLFHAGGIVGSASASGSKRVNPAVFAGAARYHGGGIVGLGSKEVPIIAEQGEEVLTRGDPRHSANGGGAVNVKNVNVFDPADVLEASMATEAGQKVILNFLAANPRKVRQTLGV